MDVLAQIQTAGKAATEGGVRGTDPDGVGVCELTSANSLGVEGSNKVHEPSHRSRLSLLFHRHEARTVQRTNHLRWRVTLRHLLVQQLADMQSTASNAPR